jgi:uncharacterized protein (TIGR03437 family)
MKTKSIFLVLLLGVCALPSWAQSLDSNGNNLLYGNYYMRQVFYFYAVENYELVRTMNVQGNISFDGIGNYSFSGSVLDTAAPPPVEVETFTATGTYVISGSGQGYISGIEFPGDHVIGEVSNGIFIGSATGNFNGYNDLMILAPVGSTATNSTLTGSYSVAYFDPTYPGDALFTMTADGQGNIGSVSATEYTGTTAATSSSQSLSGVTYSFANGAAQLKLPGKRSSTVFLAGTELLYISPDGNFVFGGSYDGYDMFAGVRAASSPPSNFAGLYYQAGLSLNQSAIYSGFLPTDSYNGSFQALSGKIIGHQRFSNVSPLPFKNLSSWLAYGGSNDFTYEDSYTLNPDGSSDDTDFSQHYVSTASGSIRIGYGIGPYLALNVALQAPGVSGSGVYLDPVGVVNAASSAPFSAQVSPGEFLTLYGSGLANTTAAASLPFPKTFQGVQVMINGVEAPIYYVSPTQISVVVPYTISAGIVAQIYVVNNGANSNLVSAYTGFTSVGVFTNNPVGGLGYAAALHPDNSVISASSPAQAGETVAVYLAGMGAVSLPVNDGAPAPSNPLSVTTSTPLVFVLDAAGHYLQGTVAFSGLAPGFAGLYQINFTIPSGAATGNATLEIIGQDSDTFQALLPLAAQ